MSCRKMSEDIGQEETPLWLTFVFRRKGKENSAAPITANGLPPYTIFRKVMGMYNSGW